MEKSSNGIDWQQKGPKYGPVNLETWMSENVQNLTVINFVTKSMENWRVELTVGAVTLAAVKIKKTSFKETYSHHCYSLLQWWNSITNLKGAQGYKFTKSDDKINHVMYMDALKVFAKKRNKNRNWITKL